MNITFLGAVEEVTGSRYVVEHNGIKILVDCGLFQGPWEITKHNWEPFPVAPKSIDAIILTHAHIDHTGFIPAFTKNGFTGRIYCSKATYALCAILLVDSGAIQEEDAKRRNKHKDPEHQTEPLYTKLDAEKALRLFQQVDYDTPFTIKGLQVTLTASYHILGASFVIVSDGKQKLTFSGDLGRPHRVIMKPTPHLSQTDYLVLESTYGDRLHEEGDPLQIIGEIVNDTVKKGGVLIIPAFAVGRTQTILYCLYQLKQKNLIPDIPIFLDSPMAISVNDLLCRFKDEHTLSPSLCKNVLAIATYTPTAEESKQIDLIKQPAIIIAGSGMADGGRVIHHLKQFISDPRNTIAFVGFQAKGALGSVLVNGASEVKMHGEWFPVRAEIKTINMFSAHADYQEIIEWLESFEKSIKKVFLTHGDLDAAQSLQKKIEERFGWPVVIPQYLESFDLD